MGTGLIRNRSTPTPPTSIRIEVDSDTDDRLEAWAGREHRSKREHVRYLVVELLTAYAADPYVLHRLALARAAPPR